MSFLYRRMMKQLGVVQTHPVSIRQDIQVRMPDGAVLLTDLYLGSAIAAAPVIMIERAQCRLFRAPMRCRCAWRIQEHLRRSTARAVWIIPSPATCPRRPVAYCLSPRAGPPYSSADLERRVSSVGTQSGKHRTAGAGDPDNQLDTEHSPLPKLPLEDRSAVRCGGVRHLSYFFTR
jgi:hypothetical protein